MVLHIRPTDNVDVVTDDAVDGDILEITLDTLETVYACYRVVNSVSTQDPHFTLDPRWYPPNYVEKVEGVMLYCLRSRDSRYEKAFAARPHKSVGLEEWLRQQIISDARITFSNKSAQAFNTPDVGMRLMVHFREPGTGGFSGRWNKRWAPMSMITSLREASEYEAAAAILRDNLCTKGANS